MSGKGKVIIVAMLLFSVIVSGCADQSTTEEEIVTEVDTEQNISVADEMLSQEMVGITDSEMEDLEADLAELEALISEMDLEEEIVIEEI